MASPEVPVGSARWMLMPLQGTSDGSRKAEGMTVCSRWASTVATVWFKRPFKRRDKMATPKNDFGGKTGRRFNAPAVDTVPYQLAARCQYGTVSVGSDAES